MERERESQTTDPAAAGVFETPGDSSSRQQCEACGQVYDMRNLGLVLHHLERGHAPLPLN